MLSLVLLDSIQLTLVRVQEYLFHIIRKSNAVDSAFAKELSYTNVCIDVHKRNFAVHAKNEDIAHLHGVNMIPDFVVLDLAA